MIRIMRTVNAGGDVSTVVRPWVWSDEEQSWVRLSATHVPLARIKPPSVQRKTATCSVYAPNGAVGRTCADVQSAAEWCDGHILRLGYKVRLEHAPIPASEVDKGMRYVWLRMWGTQPSY